MLERWNGNRGIGNLNAKAAMRRAIALAGENVIGAVGLSNTNHWMRPGNYGLMAAEAGCIGILWTNTLPNMPPWGGREPKLGNNPIVIAVPNGEEPVLLDIAMSMFAYGKLESYVRQGRELPMDGGFDREQKLTRDPGGDSGNRAGAAVWLLERLRPCPHAGPSGGGPERRLHHPGDRASFPHETGVSQVFFAVDLKLLPDGEHFAAQVKDTLSDLQSSAPREEGGAVTYPGQRMMAVRRDSMENGVPADESVWEAVKAM